MKVLHYVHSYGGFSGATKQAKSLAECLNKNNCKSKFVSEKNARNLKGYSSECNFLSPGIIGFLQFLKILITYKPDIVHFHGASFKYLFPASLLSRVYWKTTLFGNDDFKTLTSVGYFKGGVKRYMLRLIHKNNSLTQQNRSVNRYFIEEKKIVTIPNGVEFYDDLTYKKEKVIVVIAAVIPRKRVLESIFFFKNNFEEHGFKLFVIGPFEDISLHGADADYSKHCKELETNNIHFTGILNSKEVQQYLERAMYMMLFSTSEGLPNVVLESLACGTYPILTSIGGVAEEIITNNNIGMILSESDITNQVRIPMHTTEVFNVCRKAVKERFSMAIVAKKTYETYSELLK